MDDGGKDANSIRINTQSFSYDENIFIIEVLRAKFGIVARVNRDKDKFRLRVATKSMPFVRQLLEPYIIPSMLYKLSP